MCRPPEKFTLRSSYTFIASTANHQWALLMFPTCSLTDSVFFSVYINKPQSSAYRIPWRVLLMQEIPQNIQRPFSFMLGGIFQSTLIKGSTLHHHELNLKKQNEERKINEIKNENKKGKFILAYVPGSKRSGTS